MTNGKTKSKKMKRKLSLKKLKKSPNGLNLTEKLKHKSSKTNKKNLKIFSTLL